MSRVGKKWKKILSTVMTLMLLGNGMEGTMLSALAQEEEMIKVLEIPPKTEQIVLPTWETSAMETNIFALGTNELVRLKEGNHFKWIERLDLTDAEYAYTFYNWLIENSDNDGVADGLINPTDSSAGIVLEDGKYVYPVVEFNDSVSFTYTKGANDAQDEENALAAAQVAVSDALEGKAKEVYAHVAAVYSAFDRDFPKVFWLSGSSNILTSTGYDIHYNDGNGTATYKQAITFLLKDADFDIRKEEYQDLDVLKSVYGEVFTNQDSALKNITDSVADSSDRFEKVFYFHNWLTNANCYNSDVNNAGCDAYECISALKGLIGAVGPVCEGYARAFKVLCDEEQIPCVLVNGDADNGSGSPSAHMWNYVQMEDGNWYAVDVTWDDPTVKDLVQAESGYERRDYFLVGGNTVIDSKNFIESHSVSNQVTINGVGFINGPELEKEAYEQSEECIEHTGGIASCSQKAICVNCGESYGEYEVHAFSESKCQNCNLEIVVKYQELNYTETYRESRKVSGNGIITVTAIGEMAESLESTGWSLVNNYGENGTETLATATFTQNKAVLEFEFDRISYDSLNALQVEMDSSIVINVNKLYYISVDNAADGWMINGLDFFQMAPYIMAGQEVTVDCGTLEGKKFEKWEVYTSQDEDYWANPILLDGYSLEDETIKFYMPEEGGVALNTIWSCFHTDKNDDHCCDNCESYLKELCYDDNGDHFCDEKPCCVYLPELCIDDDDSHYCDICETYLVDLCVDEDENHICDVCENCLWMLCEDSEGDGDHECDTCGENCTECVDADEDHICEECNQPILCEHEYEDGTVTYNGDGTHTGICILCAETVTESCDYCYKYDWDENVHWESCICGATDPECVEKTPHSFDEDYYNEIGGDEVEHEHECDSCYYVKYEFHVDMDGDRVCDLCEMSSVHSDSNPKNHVCDCGCGLPYGTHEDVDKDHVCDYGCEKAYGTCGDKDKDHVCDYGCGLTYGSCSDEEKDGDHTCDYGCGKEYGICSGGLATCKDKAVCEECGQAYGSLDPNNHMGETEVRDAKSANCTEEGYSGDTYCMDCGKKVKDGKKTPKTNHKDEDKNQVCDDCRKDLSNPLEIVITDVKKDGWQYPFVYYVISRDIMKGKKINEDGSIVFDPDKTMTRAEFAQVLYNAEEKPSVEYKDSFKDVGNGKWYTNAILWASEKGIVSGYGNGKFGVSDPITREQLATMLYKYAQYKGCDINGDCDLSIYDDKDTISSWAVKYMKWAVANNVMKGKKENLDPNGNATRAECAAMLKNFMDRYEK